MSAWGRGAGRDEEAGEGRRGVEQHVVSAVRSLEMKKESSRIVLSSVASLLAPALLFGSKSGITSFVLYDPHASPRSLASLATDPHPHRTQLGSTLLSQIPTTDTATPHERVVHPQRPLRKSLMWRGTAPFDALAAVEPASQSMPPKRAPNAAATQYASRPPPPSRLHRGGRLSLLLVLWKGEEGSVRCSRMSGERAAWRGKREWLSFGVG